MTQKFWARGQSSMGGDRSRGRAQGKGRFGPSVCDLNSLSASIPGSWAEDLPLPLVQGGPFSWASPWAACREQWVHQSPSCTCCSSSVFSSNHHYAKLLYLGRLPEVLQVSCVLCFLKPRVSISAGCSV